MFETKVSRCRRVKSSATRTYTHEYNIIFSSASQWSRWWRSVFLIWSRRRFRPFDPNYIHIVFWHTYIVVVAVVFSTRCCTSICRTARILIAIRSSVISVGLFSTRGIVRIGFILVRNTRIGFVRDATRVLAARNILRGRGVVEPTSESTIDV